MFEDTLKQNQSVIEAYKKMQEQRAEAQKQTEESECQDGKD